MALKELSGILSDSGKWDCTLAALACADCDVETLRIYHNTPKQLQSACHALSCNTTVRALDVGDAAAEGASALAELLKASTTLCCIKVQSFASPADAASVIHGLESNNSLQELCLQGLDAAAVQLLGSAITAGPLAGRLKQLRLPSCRLDAAAVASLHGALLATAGLQLLSLRKATFENISSVADTSSSSSSSTTAASALFSRALAAHPALAKLELQQVSGLLQQDWRQLGSYVAQASCLQELHLQETKLGPDAAASFAAGMQQHGSTSPPGLRVLDVSSCELGPAGAAELGAALGRSCRQLAVLSIGQCELGAEGAAGLCAGLAGGCCRLEVLDLSGNKLKGAEGLADLLCSTAGQSLSSLNLSSNCLGDAAAAQLATAATSSSNSSSLSSLDLSCNWIGDEGANAVAEMLQRHRSLTTLLMQKNRIRRGGVDVLVNAALAAQGPLQELRLEGNRAVDPMSRLSLQDLARVLAQRRRQGFVANSSSRRASAADAAVVAAAEEGEYMAGIEHGGDRIVADCSLVSDLSNCSAVSGSAPCVVEEECVSPQASKVAGVANRAGSSSSSTSMAVGTAALPPISAACQADNGAVAWGNSSSTQASAEGHFPYATAAAATATVDAAAAGAALLAGSPTAAADLTSQFLVPVGFAERLLDRVGNSSMQRSHSFEHWSQHKPHMQHQVHKQQQQQQQQQQPRCQEAQAALQSFFLQSDGSKGGSSSRSNNGILAGMFAGIDQPQLDPVAAAAAAAAAASGQGSDLEPVLESFSGWLLEKAGAGAGAGDVVLPAEFVKVGGSSNSSSGSKSGSGAPRAAAVGATAAAAAAPAAAAGTSSAKKRGAAGLTVRLQGSSSRGRGSSREGSPGGKGFVSCSSGSESENESGCDAAGKEYGNSSSSVVKSPTAAARCAVRKLGSPRASVVVAKGAAAAAAAAGGSQRMSRFAAEPQAGQEDTPHANGATQQLL